MYTSARNQPIYGKKYKTGERIPADVLNRLGARKLNALLNAGRIRYSDEEVRAPEPVYKGLGPVYKGRGWWEFPNGMKVRGTKDKPPI